MHSSRGSSAWEKCSFRTHDAVVVTGASDGRVVLWNDAAVRVFGYGRDEALGLLIEDLVPDSHKAAHRAGLERYARDGHGDLIDSGAAVELPAVHKDGRSLSIELSLTPLRPAALPGRYAMAIVRDVTERKHLEDELRRSHALLEGSQALAKVGSWEWDVSAESGAGVRWSRQMYRIHGADPDALVISDATVEALIHPEDRDMWRRCLDRAAESMAELEGFTYRSVHPDGSTHWVWTEAHPDPDRPSTLVGFVQDVTDQKATNDELQRLALVDELTGLRNRRGFLTIAESLLRVARREQHDVVLVYVDLDNLKETNDTQGHAAGDRALIEVATLLTDTFRESDIVARLGGDEFCVLLNGNDPEAPAARLSAALRQGTGDEPSISVSVGAVVHRFDEPSTLEHLLELADAAMYQQKARKRS